MRVRAKATQSLFVRWAFLPVCVNTPASAKGADHGRTPESPQVITLQLCVEQRKLKGAKRARERRTICGVLLTENLKGSKGSKEVSALFEADHRRERAPLLEFAAVVNQFAYRWAERAWPGKPLWISRQ